MAGLGRGMVVVGLGNLSIGRGLFSTMPGHIGMKGEASQKKRDRKYVASCIHCSKKKILAGE